MGFYRSFCFLLFLCSTLSSCAKEESQLSADLELLQQDKISKETIERIGALHFNKHEVEIIDFLLPDGSREKNYLIEGDILMNPKHLNQMRPAKITEKEYRTYNLVNSPQTIRVLGYTSGSRALGPKQHTALQRAIDNFNALDIDLKFSLSFGSEYKDYDIVVYQNPNGAAGGISGLPHGGSPFRYVQIFSGMDNYSTATNQHVITHELGHAIGLRHTDWSTRQSCGQSGPSAGWEGALHIPGTPTGYDATSIMLACFNSNEDGSFGYYDEVALNYLY